MFQQFWRRYSFQNHRKTLLKISKLRRLKSVPFPSGGTSETSKLMRWEHSKVCTGEHNLIVLKISLSLSFFFQIFAMVSLIVIVLSVLTFCLESIQTLSENYKGLFKGMEYFYLVWFSADFLARLCTCPSLPEFFKTFMTWVDITSVVPLYVNLSSSVTGAVTFLFVLRLIRIFRLFRFFRTMSGMQVIGHTLRASARELFLLVLILLIPMVIFSTLVYYAEKVRKFDISRRFTKWF